MPGKIKTAISSIYRIQSTEIFTTFKKLQNWLKISTCCWWIHQPGITCLFSPLPSSSASQKVKYSSALPCDANLSDSYSWNQQSGQCWKRVNDCTPHWHNASHLCTIILRWRWRSWLLQRDVAWWCWWCCYCCWQLDMELKTTHEINIDTIRK